MGSGRSWRRFGAVAVVALIAVGCTSAGATWPVVNPSAGQPGTPQPTVAGSNAVNMSAAPSAVHVVIPSGSPKVTVSASPVPRVTAAAVTVDNITADYTYKSELITPLAHLYGKQDFLDDFAIVTIKNNNAQPVKVVVESQIIDYTDKATDTVTIKAKSSEEVRQNPRLTMQAIDGLNSAHDADLHITVSYLQSGEPKMVLDQTSPTTVTSRRDFPWKIKGFSDQEIYDMVAVMVTPTDPGVEDLLRAAANYDPSKSMVSGYHSTADDKGDVYQRMADIWAAETNDFKLTYISTTVSFEASTQRIRLPSEVLTQSGGNCIETSLLYASVAEALGLDSAIILIPGHAYVGISVDSQDENYYFIETTMIGQATFDEAVKYALGEWKEAQPHVQAGEKEYGWVDIGKARAAGITPIPWH